MKEALYIVEFGDVDPGRFRNGGVAVLETNRIFGGDSGYFYIGNYKVKDAGITATVIIEKHDPTYRNAFGDAALRFTVELVGTVSGDVISGTMMRTDKPQLKLPVKLTFKANLP